MWELDDLDPESISWLQSMWFYVGCALLAFSIGPDHNLVTSLLVVGATFCFLMAGSCAYTLFRRSKKRSQPTQEPQL